MRNSQIIEIGEYVMDNNPEFEDTTFIKIDYLEDTAIENSWETGLIKDKNLSNEEDNFKVPESQLSYKRNRSWNIARNIRVKEALTRINKHSSFNLNLNMEQKFTSQQQLLELMKILTWEIQAKSNKKCSKTDQTKLLRLKYKSKIDKNSKSIDSCDSLTCSGSENGKECIIDANRLKSYKKS